MNDELKMIIDFHTHIYRYHDSNRLSGKSPFTSDDLLIALDQANVDRAVIVPLIYVSSPLPQPILMDNEYVLESAKKYSDRLLGFASINPRQENSLEEMKSLLDRGISGIKLMPTAHGYVMSNHYILDPFLEICADYRVPVFVLVNDEAFSTPLQIEEMARTHISIPAFVIGQMGKKWLFDEAIMVAGRNANIYLETSDASIGDIDLAVKGAGYGSVLYASHGNVKEMIYHIQRHYSVIPDPYELEMVLSGNARKILGL